MYNPKAVQNIVVTRTQVGGDCAGGNIVCSFFAGIVRHELGHSVAKLGDDDGRTTGENPNLSANSNPQTVRWRNFIGLPDNNGSTVGVVNKGTNIYSPAKCTMGGGSNFCPVCEAALIESMAGVVGIPFYGTAYEGIGKTRNTQSDIDYEEGHGRILPYSFHGLADLETLTLPYDIGEIGKYAFLKCTGLATINAEMTTPPTIDADREFFGVDRSMIRLIVPTGTEDAYISAGWTDFDMDGSGAVAPRFTVSFDTDGGTDIEDKSVREGRTVSEPLEPTKNNFDFVGWFDEDGEEYEFDTPVTKNITLYAKWEAKPKVDISSYSIIFNSVYSIWDYEESNEPNVRIMMFMATIPGNPPLTIQPSEYSISYGYDFSVDNTKATMVITPKAETNYIGQIRQDFEVINAPNEGSSTPEEPTAPEDTPIFGNQKASRPMLFKSNIVSDKMEIMLINFHDTRFVVYDLVGNIVGDGFRSGNNKSTLTWDLKNSAGRFVANGSYLVVVEAKDSNGVKYRWSEKLGVRR
jgi:uncharacterized repeat protein (TIGR02543 family)